MGNSNLLILTLLDFAELVLLRDEFTVKGIDVTVKNPEDMYIDIIEREDQALIDTLERYLTLKENLHTLNVKVDEFKYFSEKAKSDSRFLDMYLTQNLDRC